MKRRLVLGLLIGVLGPVAGCDSGTSSPYTCVDSDTAICSPNGFPFAVAALTGSDACLGGADPVVIAEHPDIFCGTAGLPAGATTATVTQLEAGKLCLAGAVASRGWASLGVFFSQRSRDGMKVLTAFDADARGITQVAFTLDSPPSAGVAVGGTIVTARDCPTGPADCNAEGFYVVSTAGTAVPARFTDATPQVVPFARFEQTVAGEPPTFDTRGLEGILFELDDAAGAYDFCVHDFKFLDAAGTEVK